MIFTFSDQVDSFLQFSKESIFKHYGIAHFAMSVCKHIDAICFVMHMLKQSLSITNHFKVPVSTVTFFRCFKKDLRVVWTSIATSANMRMDLVPLTVNTG